MLKLLLTLVVAPALVGISTLAARRWGQRLGGVVSAFPAIALAVLLIDAHEQGTAFAARAAAATLLGLVALSAFVVTFGRLARRAGWSATLAAGWLAAAATVAVLSSGGDMGAAASLAVAAGSLTVAYLALPTPTRSRPRSPDPA